MLPLQDHFLRNASFVVVVCVLFLAARDSLKRAYVRMLAITTKEDTIMTNGDPGPGKGKSKKQVHGDPTNHPKSELKEPQEKQPQSPRPETQKETRG